MQTRPTVKETSIHGLDAWLVENGVVSFTLVPGIGGKIYDLVYLPLNRNILWHNPQLELSKVDFGASYDDVFTGGWDEMFPNDEEAVFGDFQFPDHGEFWSIPWDCGPVQVRDGAGVSLSAMGPVSGVKITKEITLLSRSPVIRIRHRLEHLGRSTLPFLWKLHPSFHISPHHRIDLPPNRMKVETEYSSQVASKQTEFQWPVYEDRNGFSADFRIIPDSGNQTHFFGYATQLEEGWFALTDLQNDLGFAFSFPTSVFPTCWIFASFGGWRSHYCMLIEPCSGLPYRLEEAVENGTCPMLEPGQVIEVETRGVFFRGLSEVSFVSADGTVQGTRRSGKT